ncbi:MAG: 50S ribosome-binding GTPase, partial [Victivallales bacterium]|nr:50S ribosome-binding GTPase [Victivallales bacterium]
MSLNETPSANRLHIGFFGRRNAGKSSLVNAIANQEVSIVSPIQGTTTDPVGKSMELLPLGPVVILDTPGLDDVGELGALRVRRTRQALNRIDLAALVVDATTGYSDCDRELLTLMTQKGIPYLVALNKCDLLPSPPPVQPGEIAVSAITRLGLEELKERLAHLVPDDGGRRLLDGLV